MSNKIKCRNGRLYRNTRRFKTKKRYRRNNLFKIIMLKILTISIATLLVILWIKSEKSSEREKIVLSNEEIVAYIEISDEISANKPQVDWQEVAAINGVLNNGDFTLIEKEKTILMGNEFYKQEKEKEVIAIREFHEVLNRLKLNRLQKRKAKNYKVAIKDNTLDSTLVLDSNRKKFIDRIKGYAIKNYNEHGILPSITIGQAILESSWGESKLADKYNNLFGIKADSRWDGKSINMKTKEKNNDVINANFRVYRNKKASISDHGKFLKENIRYEENGVFISRNYKEQAEALERAGYSTVEDEYGEKIYADLLISVIRKNNLMLFDTIAQREK